jgi:hypothetical protein
MILILICFVILLVKKYVLLSTILDFPVIIYWQFATSLPLFLYGTTAHGEPCALYWGFSITHTIRHTVGLLWTRDQPVAEASTYTEQHNI